MSAAARSTSLQVDLTITLATPLSVGASGSSGGMADKSLLRDGSGNPIIPGSQIKGRLRHACERIARALACPVCGSPVPDAMCPHDGSVTREATEELHRYRARDNTRQCVVCAVFGSPTYPSPLSFGDAVMLKPGTDEPLRGHVPGIGEGRLRPGVGIDRRRRTTLENVLFFVETTDAGVALRSTIQGRWWETPPEAVRPLAGLLVAGARLTARWGGGSSRGLGWAETKVSARIDGVEQQADALMEEVATLCRTAS